MKSNQQLTQERERAAAEIQQQAQQLTQAHVEQERANTTNQ